MTDIRKETDSLGVVEVPADKLWGAETQAGCSGCRRHFQRRHALGAYAENPAVTLVSGAPNSNGRWSSVMRAMLIGLLATAPLLGIFGEAQAESGPRSNTQRVPAVVACTCIGKKQNAWTRGIGQTRSRGPPRCFPTRTWASGTNSREPSALSSEKRSVAEQDEGCTQRGTIGCCLH
jgi:hypothetical protein